MQDGFDFENRHFRKWFGLKNLYKLTANNYSVLRVDVITRNNEQLIFDYDGFRIIDDQDFKMDYQQMRTVKCKCIWCFLNLIAGKQCTIFKE